MKYREEKEPLALIEYSELMYALKRMPSTWYPAILLTVVEQCVYRKVFLPGMLGDTVERMETRIRAEREKELGKRTTL